MKVSNQAGLMAESSVVLAVSDPLNNKRKYGDCCNIMEEIHMPFCGGAKSWTPSVDSLPGQTALKTATEDGNTTIQSPCCCTEINATKALRTHRSLTASASVLDLIAGTSQPESISQAATSSSSSSSSLEPCSNLSLLYSPFECTPTWADLPDDVLCRILQILPSHSHRVVRIVCRGWRAAAARALYFARPDTLLRRDPLATHFPNLRSLDLSCCDATLELRGSTSLTFRSTLTDGALAPITGLLHLTELSLRGCLRLRGPGLTHLASMPSLQHVDLTGCCNITDTGLSEGLRGLARVPSVTLLDCWGISDVGVGLLATLPGLQRLALPPRTTDKGLATLAMAPALQRVALRGCVGVGPAGIEALLKAPRLTRVIVSRCSTVTASALGGVAPNVSVVSCVTVNSACGVGPKGSTVSSARGLPLATVMGSDRAWIPRGGAGVAFNSGGGMQLARPMVPAIAAPDLQLLMATFHY